MCNTNARLLYYVKRIQDACDARKWMVINRSDHVGVRFGKLNDINAQEFAFTTIEEAYAFLMGIETGEILKKHEMSKRLQKERKCEDNNNRARNSKRVQGRVGTRRGRIHTADR